METNYKVKKVFEFEDGLASIINKTDVIFSDVAGEITDKYNNMTLYFGRMGKGKHIGGRKYKREGPEDGTGPNPKCELKKKKKKFS